MTSPPLAVSIKGKGRMYKHPVTGELYPSITNVIDLLDKPALIGWAARETAGAAWDHRFAIIKLEDREACVDMLKNARFRSTSRAAQVGTTVHEVCEALARDEPLPAFTDEEEPYLDGFLHFCSDYSPEFRLVEATVFNDTHRYAGTFDFAAGLGGHYVLGDVKTGKGVYQEVALQIAAARYGETVWDRLTGDIHPMRAAEGAVALHLRPGGYTLYQVRADEDAFRAFCGLRQAWDWAKDNDAVGPAMSLERLKRELPIG